MDDGDVVAQRHRVGVPGRECIQNEDRICPFEERRRIGADLHRMVEGQGELVRPVVRQRQGVGLAESAQGVEAGRAAGAALRDDQRGLGRGQHLRRPLQRGRVRGGGDRGDAGRGVEMRQRTGLAEHLARQAEIDGTLRGGIGDGPGAVHQVGDLVGEAQFVGPLRRLADQGLLVEHLLPPADRHRPGAEARMLGRRGAARHQDHRHLVAPGVDDRRRSVCQADVRVQQDGLRAPGSLPVSMRHRHGGMLVRHRDRRRQVEPRPARLHQSFDDRRKVRAGIGEDVVYAQGLQLAEDRAASGDGPGSGHVVHRCLRVT